MKEKKQRNKRVLSGLLCAVFLLGLLSGCGGQQDGGSKEGAKENAGTKEEGGGSGSEAGGEADSDLEHMEITVSYWDIDGKMDGDMILDTIEEKFNVEFVPMNVTWDDYHTKLELWASTNELPDVFVTDVRTTPSFANWIKDGVVRAIPEDLSAYPNLEKYLDCDARDTCMFDGKLYAIFRRAYQEPQEVVKSRTIVYRWDLAQQAGIEKEPETWEEFREMLRAIVAADPEGKNICGMTAPGANYMTYHMLAYTVPRAIIGGSVFQWEDQDGTYVPIYFSGETLGENVLPTFQLARDMYTEGTIDPDIALSTEEQSRNKFLNGQAAAYLQGIDTICGNRQSVALDWEKIYGSPMSDAVKFMKLMPSVDGQIYYWQESYAWSESMFSAHVDDAKMERLLMIYDYLLTEEVALLTEYGVEGENYTTGEDGRIQENEDAPVLETYPSALIFGNLASWVPNVSDESKKKLPSTLLLEYQEMAEDYVQQAKACKLPEYVPECTQIFNSLDSGFGVNLSDDLLTIMTGTEPVEDMWNQILEDYKADGLEEVIQQVNDAMK